MTDPSGKVRAVLVNYACHCTTLGGEFNKVCAEWAGYACDEIEREHPGATALVVIGCGADANPEPRRNLDDAKNHAAALAKETERLVSSVAHTAAWSDHDPVQARSSFRLVPFPIARLSSGDPRRQGAEGFFAGPCSERIDRGERLPGTIPYPVQTWCFGDRLAMVFLGGEVVVDYALRLKWETDAGRVWITAYSNDVPCYIASKARARGGGIRG